MNLRRFINRARIRRALRRTKDQRRAHKAHAAALKAANRFAEHALGNVSTDPNAMGLYLAGGFDPSQIPDDARSVRWEACHLFSPYAKLPERTHFGLMCHEPPLAMACPECDVKQPVLHPGTVRKCAYCGSTLMTHGTRVYVWQATTYKVKPWGQR